MKWLESKLGNKFPFPKYYQFAVPNIGGAMENVTLTSWDQRFVCDEMWAKEYKTITDIVVCHEMTHSYFGDAIGCRFFEHSWLKESWATYMEWNWLNDFKVFLVGW